MKVKKKAVLWLGIVTVLLLLYISYIFPIPRGERVNPQYYSYYKNLMGIYYISVENSIGLFNHGIYRYLNEVDPNTFQVLAEAWAKDKNHVWHRGEIVEVADIASFKIDKSGLAKDKNHVYVDDEKEGFHATKCGIDVETAEYFILESPEWFSISWMRDKNNVFFHEKRAGVDRNTFRQLGQTQWLMDKDGIYTVCWDTSLNKNVFVKVDSLQTPIDTLSTGYLRNGRNVIYLSKIIVKDKDITKFEEVGHDGCRVNDMLFENGSLVK